jgi:hypothetical protein
MAATRRFVHLLESGSNFPSTKMFEDERRFPNLTKSGIRQPHDGKVQIDDGISEQTRMNTLISLTELICELQRDWARKEIQYEAS